MQRYRVKITFPFCKGTDPIYQIHDAQGPIPQLRWDYEPLAKVICDDLNDGLDLLAEIHYKLNGQQQTLVIACQFAAAEDIIYVLESQKLCKYRRTPLTTAEKRLILLKEGYSEISISWRSLPLFE
ncbi:hypothetical protein J1G33_20410 [Pseudomonas sp. P867]|uniref:hypothetical protein n=1 Tax=Pseudomonas sp. P867 TaxID=2816050 RepID=UPI001CA7260C|nr:hypothetical protein [Pseudomonas sp. P867]MBY8972757.1 hypothetical protein [Pseudomonas sp. P867]